MAMCNLRGMTESMGTRFASQAFGGNLPSWTILVFLGTAIAISVCRKHPEKSAEPPGKVTTAYLAILHPGLLRIAFTKGFFSAESLGVTFQPHPFWKVALELDQ